MCKVISVVNQKGGVGKTTTTVNVGIGLAREGKKVLLIDADPQGSLTASLGYEEPDDLRITLATIMMDVINEEEINLEDGILHHQENVDLLPANIELSALEVTMGNVMSREMIMKEYIDAIRSRYDYILIDCMPSLGMMTINALVSSDSVLIPVQAAYLPVKGLQQLIKTILTVKKRLNRKLAIEGILLNMVDFRTNYARDIASRVHTTYARTGKIGGAHVYFKTCREDIITAGMDDTFCDRPGSEDDSTDLCGCQRNPWIYIHFVDYSDCILLP